jgi:DNA adenine methylase
MEPKTKSKTKAALVAECKERGLKGLSGKSIDELNALLSKDFVHVNKSPLRYPGGKTRAIAILEAHLLENFADCKTVLSPFFGGGSFELHLYDKGYKIYGNDLFKPLWTFWRQCQTGLTELVGAVKAKMPVTKELFTELRTTITKLTEPLAIATAYYIINRTSFSGATFCGGFSRQAATGRLNESSLETLSGLAIPQLEISNLDFAEFMDLHPDVDGLVIYADPPYYISSYIYGKDGDMHEGFNHVAFAAKIKTRRRWMLSYNDCPYIRNLYSDCRIIGVSWSYGMNVSKASSEILIFPL